MWKELKNISRKLKIFLVAVVMGAGIFTVTSYKVYDYVENDPRFCRSCHIMKTPFKKWSESPHHMVNCHECHKQTKKESLHQLWMYVTQRPDAVIHHPELDHKTCAQCHMSNDTQWKRIQETAGHKIHFEKAGIECLDCHMKGIHEFVRPIDACVECHSDKPGNIGKMAFLHCLQCHNFLGEGKQTLIPSSEVCQECHKKIQTEKIHPPYKKGEECLSCHKPHDLKKGAP